MKRAVPLPRRLLLLLLLCAGAAVLGVFLLRPRPALSQGELLDRFSHLAARDEVFLRYQFPSQEDTSPAIPLSSGRLRVLSEDFVLESPAPFPSRPEGAYLSSPGTEDVFFLSLTSDGPALFLLDPQGSPAAGYSLSQSSYPSAAALISENSPSSKVLISAGPDADPLQIAQEYMQEYCRLARLPAWPESLVLLDVHAAPPLFAYEREQDGARQVLFWAPCYLKPLDPDLYQSDHPGVYLDLAGGWLYSRGVCRILQYDPEQGGWYVWGAGTEVPADLPEDWLLPPYDLTG